MFEFAKYVRQQATPANQKCHIYAHIHTNTYMPTQNTHAGANVQPSIRTSFSLAHLKFVMYDVCCMLMS